MINERRELLRPDLERFAKPSAEILRFPDIDEMVREVIANIKRQGNGLDSADKRAAKLAFSCIREIEELHNVPDVIKDPPLEVDVIWIVSAPGLLLEHGSKIGWSEQFSWLNDCEWEVIGAGFALAEAVTAKRLSKSVDQVTRDDIRDHGPWIVYNSNPWENEAVETILKESDSLPIAQERVYIYQPSSESPSYVRTADQARDIRMPESIQPRLIAISVLAAQWARLGRILATTQTLPQGAEVLLVPVPSPKGYEREHAVLETQGAVINTYIKHSAELTTIPYRLR